MIQQLIRVLIIEDEPGIALALYKSLNQASYKVETAKSGLSGLRKAAANKFDVIILDLGLPDMSGLTICKQLRADGSKASIMILTGESDVSSKVKLFDAGANDYITKPFSLEELHARVRACLRQVPKPPPIQELKVGEITLRSSTRTVERAGAVIPLRRKEFAILECLMQHAGTVVTRAKLTSYAWDDGDDSWTNTIDVHIKHLRDKIDRPFDSALIKTVHGLGYQFEHTKKFANA